MLAHHMLHYESAWAYLQVELFHQTLHILFLAVEKNENNYHQKVNNINAL